MAAAEQTQNESQSQAKPVVHHSKKLEEDVRLLGLKIKQHDENINFLKALKKKLDDSILDMQVSVGKYYSASAPTENKDPSHGQSEEESVEGILRHANSAAAILCELKAHHEPQASNLPWMKDVLGVVAVLGKVEDDNLNRLLSEYLGLDTMLAVVCRTHDCVKALETYNKEGFINKSSGLHGLGNSIGRPLNGRFMVICLENLQPYVGGCIVNDPQMRLDILKPKLPNGESPPGFLGFAVNMINIDYTNLCFVSPGGHGLRETLFYHLFSRLQVYKTREDMFQALPLISNGALSLDGGMIRSKGLFSLGDRKDIDLKFPKSSGRPLPPEIYFDTESALKEKRWQKERLLEDMQREQALLDQAKFNYEIKKQQLLKFLADSSSYTTPHQVQSERERLNPR